MPKPKATFEARVAVFWSYVDRSAGPDGCWPWTRGAHENGYGRFWIRDRLEGSHRLAFELARGPVPDGLWVLHECDNPPCCNPAHLFLGTNDDNVADMHRKRRDCPPPRHSGVAHPSAKLSESGVRDIRTRAAAGEAVRALAAEYGVTWQQIDHVVKRRHWRHVE